MRKVTFTMNISLDGYCDHTIFGPSEEMMDFYTALMDDVDLIFFGRVMYQLMFPYWADVAINQSGTAAENRFAERLNSINRAVMSTTLSIEEPKTRILRGRPAEELLKLKQQPGKKISVDSVSMLPELIAAELIDEFHLVVLPVMVGKGRRLLDTVRLQDKLKLNLVGTRTFKNGCVAAHYLK